MENTFDYEPEIARQVTQTITIPKMVITSKESHEIRELIDKITRR